MRCGCKLGKVWPNIIAILHRGLIIGIRNRKIVMDALSLRLLLCLVLTAKAAVVTYPKYIQTGSFSVGGLSSGSHSLDNNYNIALATAMNTSSYQAGLCYGSIRLEICTASQEKFDTRVAVVSRSNSILEVRLRSTAGIHLLTMNIRYLVVHPDFGFIKIEEILSNSGLNFSLTPTNSFTYTLNGLSNPSSADYIIYLSGFKVVSPNSAKKFNLFTALDSTSNNHITISVSATVPFIELDYVGHTIVIIDISGMNNRVGDGFPRGSSSFSSGTTLNYNNANTLIYDNNSFVGVRSFHTESQSYLTIQISITSTTSFTVTSPVNLDYLEMSHLIFASGCPSGKFVNPVDNSCLSTCPSGTLGNSSTSLCQQCSASCGSCSGYTTSCTSCPDNTTFLNSSTCQICNASASLPNCLRCSSSSVCLQCDSVTFLNSSNKCQANCTTINHCSSCEFAPHLNCTTCDTNYQPAAGICRERCGDGVIIGSETCDDSNTVDNDGCSSVCRVQPYFTCTGTPSVCILTSLGLAHKNLLKDPTVNSFTVTYQLSPASLPCYNSVNWKLAFLPGSMPVNVEEATYDPATNTLTVRSSYTASLQGQSIAFQFDPTQTGATMMSSLTPTQLSGPSETDNNLSLQHFSEQVYILKKVMEYLAMAIGILSLILFIAGYFGAKLIALENAAVVQLSYISLASLRNITPSFHALTNLSFSFSYSFPSKEYNYSNSLLHQFRGMQLSGDFLGNYNLVLIFIFVPLLLAAGSKVLSLTVMKQRPMLSIIWKRFLCEFVLYGILFTSYTVFFSMGISLRNWSGEFGNLIVGILFLALLVGLTVASNYLPKSFGEFKRRFEVMNICRFTYHFIAAERFLTPLLIATLTLLSFQLVFVVLIFGSLLAFVAIRKPYVPDSWRRPTCNLSISTAILLIYLSCKMAGQTSIINVIAPGIILLLLGACMGYNSLILVRQVRENWKSLVEQKLQSSTMAVEDCEKIRFEMFEKQMMPENSGLLTNTINKEFSKMAVDDVNLEWERYAELSHNKFYEEMKERILKTKLKNVLDTPRKDGI